MTEIWQVINGSSLLYFEISSQNAKKKKKKDRKSVFILILLGEKKHYKI